MPPKKKKVNRYNTSSRKVFSPTRHRVYKKAKPVKAKPKSKVTVKPMTRSMDAASKRKDVEKRSKSRKDRARGVARARNSPNLNVSPKKAGMEGPKRKPRSAAKPIPGPKRPNAKGHPYRKKLVWPLGPIDPPGRAKKVVRKSKPAKTVSEGGPRSEMSPGNRPKRRKKK
jgi:hypothetical protein